MIPDPQNLPENWYEDGFKSWALVDAARQDDEIKRLSGQLEVIKDKLEGKAKQDIDAAHKSIRHLSALSEELRRKLLEKQALNWAITAVISIVSVLLVLGAAALIPGR